MIRLGEGGMLLTVAFLFCFLFGSMRLVQNYLVFSYAPVKDFLHNLQIIFLSAFLRTA